MNRIVATNFFAEIREKELPPLVFPSPTPSEGVVVPSRVIKESFGVVRTCLKGDLDRGVRAGVRECKKKKKRKVELKYKSPLVNSVPLVDDRLYRGVDPQPCSPTNPFRGLHLICATPRFHSAR